MTKTQARFWSNVNVDEATGCFIWTGCINAKGYGLFWNSPQGKNVIAHRFAYQDVVGPIPFGLQLDHLCRNRPCVNPDHLEPVTPRINSLRGRSIQRERTHCRTNHPYDDENTYVNAEGHRSCKACHRESQRRYMQKV